MIPLVKRAGGKRKKAVTSTVSDTERPLRADARRNREQILQSARAVFAESGAEAQIDDVARHAGVGVGTVYRHFPTKQALLTELVRQTFRLFTGWAREALEAGGEPFALIEGLLRRIAETAAGDAGFSTRWRALPGRRRRKRRPSKAN